MTLFKGRAKAFEGQLPPDTILFDPENRRFSLVWRMSQRIQRTILDFSECWVGPPTSGMLRAKATGKQYVVISKMRPRVEEGGEAEAA